MKKIHMYQSRHLFVDDDCVGKFDGRTRTICLFPQHAQHGEAIAKWMRMTQGVFPSISNGPLAVEAVAPLAEFPAEVAALMTPFLGDLTPAVVAWARENFSADDFKRRYSGRVPDQAEEAAGQAADPFEGEEFPQWLTDDEERRVMIIRGVNGDGQHGFVASCEAYVELTGFGKTPREAMADLGEAIEYAELTKPADKDGPVEVVEEEEDSPPAESPEQPAAEPKKRGRKPKAEA